MRFKLGVMFVLTMAGLIGSASTARASLTYSQPTDPYVALENTTGNIGFITLTNDNTGTAFVESIYDPIIAPNGGEADDRATNLALISPNPTSQNTLDIGANGTANIKFSWDAVDTVIDADSDFGDWLAGFSVKYHYAGGQDIFTLVRANLRVTDPVPEPAGLVLAAFGLMIGHLSRRQRKSRASRTT